MDLVNPDVVFKEQNCKAGTFIYTITIQRIMSDLARKTIEPSKARTSL